MTKTIGFRINQEQENQIRNLIRRRGFGGGETCEGAGPLVRTLIKEEFDRLFGEPNGNGNQGIDDTWANPLSGGSK